jgi:hypothetical protein
MLEIWSISVFRVTGYQRKSIALGPKIELYLENQQRFPLASVYPKEGKRINNIFTN